MSPGFPGSPTGLGGDARRVPQHEARWTQTPLRGYQRRAAEQVAMRSTIVVLPTGAGKTLIAAAAAAQNYASTGKSTLFLVPTVLLVDQQAATLGNETTLRVAKYHGSLAVPNASTYDVLVATPAAYLAQASVCPTNFGLERFGLVVFDEVHHVVKKHPYHQVAMHLQRMQPQSRPAVLGLTASLTYSVRPEDIKKDVIRLCSELCLEGRCLFTALDDELRRDGYSGTSASSQRKPSCTGGATDSSTSGQTNTQTVHTIESNTSHLQIPGEVHTALKDMLRLVDERSVPPLHPLTLLLFDAILGFERRAAMADSTFQSPLFGSARRTRLADWGEYAVKHQAHRSASAPCQWLQVLEHLYEAARLTVASRQEGLELALMYLEMSLDLGGHEMLEPLADAWRSHRGELTRAEHLKQVLLDARSHHGSSLRCIIFVQQRVTTHILEHFVHQEPDLAGFRTACMYATGSPATPRLRVRPSDAAERLRRFASGDVTVLIATNVAEEGMDVPAANCVIRFDAIQSLVSLVQSRGRARQEGSSFLVMKEQATRSLAVLQHAEMEQRRVIAAIAEKGLADTHMGHKLHQQAQESRAAAPRARGILQSVTADQDACRERAKSLLHEYAQKVAAELQLHTRKDDQGLWQGTIVFMAPCGRPIRGVASAASKKNALSMAAFSVLTTLAKS